MATQAVEGSIAPTGDVVDFVIEIDNPEDLSHRSVA
jgi:hypothetical protein